MLLRTMIMAWVLLFSTQLSSAVEINEIQGGDHQSPFLGQLVDTRGVVTAWTSRKSFYLGAFRDDDSENSSEALKVFVSDNELADELRQKLEPGTLVTISGRVTEFRPFPELPISKWRLSIGPDGEVTPVEDQSRKYFLSITELVDVANVVILGGGELRHPSRFKPPGAIYGIRFADDVNAAFNAAEYPRDYFESLEGMRVTIPNAVAVGMKKQRWTAFPVASLGHLSLDEVTNTKLPLHLEHNIFPEIINVKTALGQTRFAISPGTKLGDLTGIMSYQNGSYILELQTILEQDGILRPVRDVVPVQGNAQFTLATLNVRNLDPKVEDHDIPVGFSAEQQRVFRVDDDVSSGNFSRLAEQIVDQLQSPSLVALQEIQDNDGSEITEEVSANQTLDLLVGAIRDAGGAEYKHFSVDPTEAHADGGQPGGNIRNAFLIRVDQNIEVTDIRRLFDSVEDGATDPFKNSRKPVELSITHKGQAFRLINVHLKSKHGDQGWYSNDQGLYYDPDDEDIWESSVVQRALQMEKIMSHIEGISNVSNETIVVLGDFNDPPDSGAIEPLIDSNLGFTISRDDRGDDYTYSHQFAGIRSAIDFIAVAGQRSNAISHTRYVGGNVDDIDAATDHNPVWMSFE